MSTLILFSLLGWFSAMWFMASQLSLASEGHEDESGFDFDDEHLRLAHSRAGGSLARVRVYHPRRMHRSIRHRFGV